MNTTRDTMVLPGIDRTADVRMQRHRTVAQFLGILGLFVAIYLVSWPVVFSFDLWVLKDRGSFLNLDSLIAQHLRLGVDTFYSYGLLPVAIQHWLFALFGAGYWPLLGCAIVTMVLIAVFCAQLLRFMPREWIWLTAILLMARMINVVNPNLPYSIVQLSLLFALLSVLYGRLDIGLAVSAIGCWSVPSLPLVMTALLAVLLFLEWLFKPGRSVVVLLRSFVPGLIAYIGVGALLAWQFGMESVEATATPLAGLRFYRQMNFGSGHALMEFLHPPGHSRSYYLVYTLFTPAAWWIVSTVCLLVFSVLALRRVVLKRIVSLKQTGSSELLAEVCDRRDAVIVLCAVIHGVFLAVAYGSTHQHYLFDPILIVGVLLGLCAMPKGGMRRGILVLFLLLGIAGQATLVRTDLQAWKGTKSAATSAGLYADRIWLSEWSRILDLSKSQSLLFLSYSTGAHHYFPSIESPEVWTMQVGQLLPADKERLLRQMDNADVLVVDLASPTALMLVDSDIQERLHLRCLTQSMQNFQVYSRVSNGEAKTCPSVR